jgi:DNA-directed RNA polymerase subunit RPC12/RpoP
VTNRAKASLTVLGAWALAIIILFATNHTSVGVLVIALPVGLLIGVARVMGNESRKISKVGVQSQGGLACPKCGGTSFKAKRSAGGKMGLGLLAPKTRVKCVTCGAQYTRG